MKAKPKGALTRFGIFGMLIVFLSVVTSCLGHPWKTKFRGKLILAVEYKGADRWAGAEDDRLIGDLWASLSEGRCRFVVVKYERWDRIEEKLSPSRARQS